MTRTEQRKREIERLKEANRDDSDPEFSNYTLYSIDQMDKALDEFEAVEHSGFSHGVFVEWMVRLLKGLPIGHITEENAEWDDGEDNNEDGTKIYQSKRYFGLFKEVDKKGKVSYRCVDKVYYIHRSDKHQLGFVTGDKNIWGLPKKYRREVTLPFYPSTSAIALKVSNKPWFGKYIYLGEYK